MQKYLFFSGFDNRLVKLHGQPLRELYDSLGPCKRNVGDREFRLNEETAKGKSNLCEANYTIQSVEMSPGGIGNAILSAAVKTSCLRASSQNF